MFTPSYLRNLNGTVTAVVLQENRCMSHFWTEAGWDSSELNIYMRVLTEVEFNGRRTWQLGCRKLNSQEIEALELTPDPVLQEVPGMVIEAIAINDFYPDKSNFVGVIPGECFDAWSASLVCTRPSITRALCCSLVGEVQWNFGQGESDTRNS